MGQISNRCLICTGAYVAKNDIEEWAAEHQRGAELQAKILAREGHLCLLRAEYRFQDYEPDLGTPLTFQNVNLSPCEVSPPSSSESPDSDLNQEGSVIFSRTQVQDKAIDCGHSLSLKKFKCNYPRCSRSYASDRQDHVEDHHRAHHLGIYYECNPWYANRRIC